MINIKTYRIEKHIIKKSNKHWKLIDNLCFESKNIYNYSNYIIRQQFIDENKYIKHNDMKKIVKHAQCYKDLGSNVGQETLKVLDQNWKSFFASIKDYKKNPHKYLGRPRIPKYLNKNGRFVVGLDTNKFKIKDNVLYFSWKKLKSMNNTFIINPRGKLMQVRFVPMRSCYIMELVYEIKADELSFKSQNIIGIDLGIDNFATISNNIGIQPIIINGRNIKSINQYYNKKLSKIQSEIKMKNDKNWCNRLDRLSMKRYNKMNHLMHCYSRYIVNYCIENNIDTIVLGNNKKWKQSSNMGKKINQKFVYIPYDNFINKLTYKCQDFGIKLIETEESYTSGTSFLDNELPNKQNYNKHRRKFRGLFVSNEGKSINADLNGAYQIIKKVFPNTFSNGIEGAYSHPVRVFIN